MNLTSTSSAADIFESLNPQRAEATSSGSKSTVNDMGADDFLALMIAQMKNQDPTKPMDNMAFMSQLAQFGTVGGIQDLNTAFGDLNTSLTGSQALQASSLVGRSVTTGSNEGSLSALGINQAGDTVYGLQASVDMGPQSSGGTFFVQDMNGRLVFNGQLPAGSGTQVVQWDGVDMNGEQLPPGTYRVSADSFYGGQTKPAAVYAHEQVVSVSIGGTGQVTLNLANGQSMGVNEVKEFY